MEMSGATDLSGPVEGGVRAVLSGAEMLIYGRMLKSSIDVFAIAEEILKEVPGEVLAAAARRVDVLAARP